ncbi:uncharacterized protein LOC129914372 [Episyrphus balteatus]|uniref:uncharacterized protein LOC129914372 n=1 Tax=Episyrphus balteatus TaxID=286459 RepID=UPI00248698D0|nr:uncharacterized protein LOC129914372 [Episyrphus balteatus]
MEKQKNSRTNAKQLNAMQKTIMTEFMGSHPSLAQNLITTCAEGRAITQGLWDTLTNKLNNAGPPIQDAKAWKKVFAAQKYMAKKKLSFNKALRKKSNGDYLYKQKRLSVANQLILEASGVKLESQVYENREESQSHSHSSTASPVSYNENGNTDIKIEIDDSIHSLDSLCYVDTTDSNAEQSEYEDEKTNDTAGTQRSHKEEPFSQDDSIQSLVNNSLQQEEEQEEEKIQITNIKPVKDFNKRKLKVEDDSIDEVIDHHQNTTNDNKNQKLDQDNTRLKLVHEITNSVTSEFQKRIETKLDGLLDIQERMLQIKEEKHKSVIALNLIKLQIKTMELDKLKLKAASPAPQ